MPYKIQGNYDELAQMARRFASEASCSQDMMQQVAHLVEALENGGWVGVGAEAFFAEMHELVFPALARFAAALKDASSTTVKIATIFSEAEEEAARQFGGGAGGSVGVPRGGSDPISEAVQRGLIPPAVGQWIKTIWTIFSKSTTLAKTFGWIKDADLGILKGPGLPLIGGLISGGVDWLTGKENFLNGIGKGLMSGGIDYGLGYATGGVYSAVIAISDLSSLAGQGEVWLERSALNMMGHMDPMVRATLNSGLDHANEVFQGARISNTVNSLKDLIWDVGFRPSMNAISNGFSTGNPFEVMRGVGTLAMNATPLGAFSMTTSFLNDSNAVHSALTHTGELFTNAGNLALSLPQLANEGFRMPLRFGAGLFSEVVNLVPNDAATYNTLNNMSRNFANFANNAVSPINPIGGMPFGGLPFSGGLLGLGCQQIQPIFNSAARQVSGFLSSLN